MKEEEIRQISKNLAHLLDGESDMLTGTAEIRAKSRRIYEAHYDLLRKRFCEDLQS